jgi:serine/threonine-protein kinase
VGAFPEDVAPFGVRGMTGNVREWCNNAYSRHGDPGPLPEPAQPREAERRVLRGGSWHSTPVLCRLAGRFGNLPTDRLTGVGFRLVRSLDR